MWNKPLWFLGAAIIVSSLIYFFFEDYKTPSQNLSAKPRRQAMDIVMFERNSKTGKTIEVSAKQIDEADDGTVHLREFQMKQAGGAVLRGKYAFYNPKDSVIEVQGPVIINAQDGSCADIDGLIWERDSNEAYTDKPVRIKGEGWLITSDKAKFYDGFTKIVCIGRVHAQVMQNTLNP